MYGKERSIKLVLKSGRGKKKGSGVEFGNFHVREVRERNKGQVFDVEKDSMLR